MAYRECRRRCDVCGRITAHWRPRFDLRPPNQPEGWRFSVSALLKALHVTSTQKWRCLECDHPWEASLLRHKYKKT
jgi:hypothetical protein